jgi:hypothetical protein
MRRCHFGQFNENQPSYSGLVGLEDMGGLGDLVGEKGSASSTRAAAISDDVI